MSTLVALEENPLVVFPLRLQEPQGVMIRAMKALTIGIRLRMVYHCSYEAAVQGISANIGTRRLR